MKIKITIVLIISIILLTGCSNSNIDNLNGSNIMRNATTDFSEEEIAIYQINSDTFDSLLESNSFESINNFSSKHHSYPKDGINYITYNSVPFEITDSFVDFINDRIIFKDYFSEINQDEKIEDLVVFEASYVPISIWIKTNEDTYFVTINEDFDSTEYTYNLYSQSDYIKKFKSQDFLLEIDGSVSLNEKSIKTYYEHSELPLLEILSSYDAQIKWKNENQVNITLDKKSYLLDVKKNTLYQKHNKKNNILSGFNGGGPYSMYYSDGEYYVDSDTLQCVILELGQKIKIEYDTEKKTVNVITK